MPGRVVQAQVKLAAMNLFEQDILPLANILDIVGFSESMFWCTRKLWRETGWVEKPKKLEHLGMSRKKSKKVAKERNEKVRLDFMQRIIEYPVEYLGFLDETSKNDHTYSQGYGRAKRGSRAKMKQEFVRGMRLTATGLLTVDGMLANRVVEGSMKHPDYLDFIEHKVVQIFYHVSRSSHL
ncbi:hypothetical protein DFH08DRAFT_820961 [Mycena albidolilacea]|uniref:Transposase n=1 Tax=Mycena albidolilacea TaxID=1033008 RepID=A0AAD7EEN3_9AGAR|nr:hypothetical protein DFH08DRAFT_820961 [Mycena albidolilacea]